MNDDIFTPPSELVAYLRWNSQRSKALSASVGITLRDMYAEAADEIEQLRKELKQVRKDKDHLRKIADKAFTLAGGCITGCRQACMCTCGYEHWHALQHKDEKQN
jgi:hypothetical protein